MQLKEVIISSVVRFARWSPGQKLVKNIFVKNVGRDSVTITHDTPSTSVFSTVFPAKVVIFTGNTFRIRVTFEPTHKQRYEDLMHIFIENETATVKLTAELPPLLVCVDHDELDFQERPCGVAMRREFIVRNCGERDFQFHWTVDYPFSIEPKSGTILAFGVSLMEATFLSQDVAEYARNAVLECEDTEAFKQLTVKLLARSHCASYLLYQPSPRTGGSVTLEFGTLALYQATTNSVSICSTLSIDVPFTIERNISSDLGFPQTNFFEVLTPHGVLHPHTWLNIPIQFFAHHSTTGVTEFFTFKSGLQDTTMDIRCVGMVQGPLITTSTELIDFGLVLLHDSAVLSFTLTNDTISSTEFQLDSDPLGSVFKASPIKGIIEKGRKTAVEVQFKPSWPVLYRSTINCLVNLQGIVSVTLIGSCHSSMHQPMLLKHHHLLSFGQRETRELSLLGPRFVKESVQAGDFDLVDHILRKHRFVNPAKHPTDPQLVLAEDNQLSKMAGWFGDFSTKRSPMPLDKAEILFGYCTVGTTLSRSIRFKSSASEPVIINWMSDSDEIFSVVPQSVVVRSHGVHDFTVTFKPGKPGTFFVRELECYVMYEGLTGFQLVEDYQIIPPWTHKIRLSGLTATVRDQNLLRPKLDLNCATPTVFRNFDQDGKAFTTLWIKNPTQDTVMYRAQKDPEEQHAVKPRFGVLSPGECQLLTLKVTSEARVNFQRDFVFVLNENDKMLKQIQVAGYYDPEIRISFDRNLNFPDTAVGLSSELFWKVLNASDSSVRFDWFVTETMAKFLKVEPDNADISGHDYHCFRFVFQPDGFKKFSTNLNCRATPVTGPFEAYWLSVTGVGTFGHISFTEMEYTFDSECLRTACTYTFPVLNKNDFAVNCRLFAKGFLPNGCDEDVTVLVKKSEIKNDFSVWVTQDNFLLPATTNESINVTFLPKYTGMTEFHFFSQPIFADGRNLTFAKLIAKVKVFARQPIMQVADVAGFGSLSSYGKHRIWNLLNLTRLNKLLREPASKLDTLKKALTYHASSLPQITCKSEVAVSLGTAVLGKESVVKVVLQNTGGPSCKWRFVFLEQTELHLKEILPKSTLPSSYLDLRANKLIDVEPKSGTLRENEHVLLEFKCCHNSVGEHILPLFLQVDKGKLIFIRLTAETILSEGPGLVVCKNAIRFPATPVCGKDSQSQYIEIHNPSNRPVSWKINSKPIREINKNSPEPIFTCGSPTGTVQPHLFAVIPWAFKPYQMKSYDLITTMIVENGHNRRSYDLNFHGKGCSIDAFCNQAKQPRELMEPTTDCLVAESQFLTASMTHLDFGCVPLFSVNRQIFFVRNMYKGVFRYKWKELPKSVTQKININPDQGVLQPNGTVLFAAKFDAQSEYCQFIQTMTLEFMEETERLKYQNWLKKWVTEVKERCQCFSVTESHPHADEDAIAGLEEIEKLEKLMQNKNLHRLNKFSETFILLLDMLKARKNVQVPPLMPEPITHEIHFTIAGETLEETFFTQAYPNHLQTFSFSFKDKPMDPTRGHAYDFNKPEISAITTSVLGKVIKSVLHEGFVEDAEEVLKSPPNLYYADMLDIEKQAQISPEQNRGNNNDYRDAKIRDERSTPQFLDFSPNQKQNRKKDGLPVSQDDDAVGISTLSPRTTVLRRADTEDLHVSRSEIVVSQALDEAQTDQEALDILLRQHADKAELLRDETFCGIAEDIMHDFITSILQDCRNHSFDLFNPPKLC